MPWQRLIDSQNPYISNPKNWPHYSCLVYATTDQNERLCRAEVIDYFDLKHGGKVNAIVLYLNEKYPDNTEESFLSEVDIPERIQSKDVHYVYDKEKNAIIFDQCNDLDMRKILGHLVTRLVLPVLIYKEITRDFITKNITKNPQLDEKRSERQRNIFLKRYPIAGNFGDFKEAESLLGTDREEALRRLKIFADENDRDAARVYAFHAHNIRERLYYFELAASLGDISADINLPKAREENAILDLKEYWSNKPSHVTHEFLDNFNELLIKTDNLLRERLENGESFRKENCLILQGFLNWHDEENAMLDLEEYWPNKPAPITQAWLDGFKTLLIKAENLFQERVANNEAFEEKHHQKFKDFSNQYHLLLGDFLSVDDDESTIHLDQAFEAYSQVNEASPQFYAEAQFNLALLVCYHSECTPEDFETETAENKKQRLETMLPFLEEAVKYGYDDATAERDRCLSQLNIIEKAVTQHFTLFSDVSDSDQEKSRHNVPSRTQD